MIFYFISLHLIDTMLSFRAHLPGIVCFFLSWNCCWFERMR